MKKIKWVLISSVGIIKKYDRIRLILLLYYFILRKKNTKSYELLSQTIKLLNKQTVIKWRIIRYDQAL